MESAAKVQCIDVLTLNLVETCRLINDYQQYSISSTKSHYLTSTFTKIPPLHFMWNKNHHFRAIYHFEENMSKYRREFKRLIFTFLFTEIDEVTRVWVGYKMCMTTSLLSMYKTITESNFTSKESYFKSGEGIGEQKRIKIIHTKYWKIRQNSFIWTIFPLS